jgi:ABC-type sugar transport system ATPase subunit
MKILAGDYPNPGEILIDGQTVSFRHPAIPAPGASPLFIRS